VLSVCHKGERNAHLTLISHFWEPQRHFFASPNYPQLGGTAPETSYDAISPSIVRGCVPGSALASIAAGMLTNADTIRGIAEGKIIYEFSLSVQMPSPRAGPDFAHKLKPFDSLFRYVTMLNPFWRRYKIIGTDLIFLPRSIR